MSFVEFPKSAHRSAHHSLGPTDKAHPAPGPVKALDSPAGTKLGDCERAHFNARVLELYVPLLSAARRLTSCEEDALDLVQDTFERALRNFGKFSGDNLQGWLFTLMKHLFFDERRRDRVFVRTKEELRVSSVGTLEPEQARLQASCEYLERALASIDGVSREILLLRELEALTYQEIAGRLGISASSAGVRLHRARVRLQQALEAGRLEAPRAEPPPSE
ncbi:MAG TPA: RNA polymerase sigma factor [Polyangiaceae bacterium]|nr:RNA polymerase sigma factor [Polyangiaceae bacterium]